MAVARITASRRWHLKAAAAVKDHKRLRKEFERAAERRGLTAEVQADEARLLAEALPKDPLALKALQEIEALEVYEANRPRARDIALGLIREREE